MIDSKLVVNIKAPAADLIGSLHVKIVYCFLYTENFMRKCYFSAVIAILLMAVSCMNVGGSSGAEGAVRVAVPGSGSRGAYTLSKDNASLYKVTLLLDGEVEGEPQTASPGGADIVFDGLEPAEYTVLVEAFDAGGVMLARKSQSIKVAAGKTADCSIVLALLGSRALDTGYLLWKYSSDPSYSFGRSESVESFNGGVGYCYGEPFGAAEDLDSNWYFVSKSKGSDNGTVYRNDANTQLFSIISGINEFFTDPLYYDETEDALWFANYANNKLNLSKNKNPSSLSGSGSLDMKEVSGFDFTDRFGFAFAVQGNDIYIVYTDLTNYYLQRGTLSGDGPFTFVPVGSAKSAEDMGLSGAITDVAILYDGTVYALVSNVGSDAGDSGYIDDMFINPSGGTFYSRGALVKIEGTNSGFRVVDVLGWTNSARKISPAGGAADEYDSDVLLQPINAYIPSLSESNGKFYGPRRFVAIKPKEIAIADCGANFVMPDKTFGKAGKMFEKNRVVTVSLYDFAVSSVKKLDGIKFMNLTISGGSGSTSGYIYAYDCKGEEIEER